MKNLFIAVMLPFKWVAYLFLQLLIRMFDDYNANFKKYNL